MSTVTETCLLVGATEAGRFILADDLSWGAAQDMWRGLDDERIKRNDVRIDYLPAKWFAVRSADDPDWSRQPRSNEVTVRARATKKYPNPLAMRVML